MTATPTACLLIIGNEVLSGRTQDANLAHIARKLGERGIALREARVIPDVPETIIGTVNEVRQKFAHVLTTGGIGPTHDDITSECIAAAFGVPWEKQPEAWARMEAFYVQRDGTAEAFNAARQRMATMPRGATLIDNAISIAPGFTIGNVHVLAGVPRIMQAMLETLLPRLGGGPPILSRTLTGYGLMEGAIAAGLEEVQKEFPGLDLGSYPFYGRGGRGNGVSIVAKGTEAAAIEAAMARVATLMQSLGVEPEEGEPPPA